MSELTWRPGSVAERDFVQGWLDAREVATGFRGALPEPLEVRDSCGCGTCPTFAVRDLVFDPDVEGWPARIEGGGGDHRADTRFGVIVFCRETETEFEIYPLGDNRVTVDDLATAVFHDTGTQA